jgi:AraC-like DNA-binding protein
MTPVRQNIESSHKPFASDPILAWTRSKISRPPINLLHLDEFAGHPLTTANSELVLVRGHFQRYGEINQKIPEHTNILIMPVSGVALIHLENSTNLLESGSSLLVSGPQQLMFAMSSNSFEFLIATISSSDLHNLIQAQLIDIEPGKTKLVINSEIIAPSQNPSNQAPTAIQAAFLLTVLIAAAPRSSTVDSFAPKVPSTLRRFSGVLSEIWENPNRDWNLIKTAERVGYSQFHFSRVFRSEFEIGFREYVIGCRIRHAANLICNESFPSYRVLEESGLNLASTFRGSLRSILGFSRTELIQFSSQNHSM